MSEEIKEKKFEILNYEELPKKVGFGVNCNKIFIDWKSVKTGFVIKTNHIDYGYNKFKFIVKENNYLYFLFNNEKRKILFTSFQNGRIGRLISKISDEFKINIGDIIADSNRSLLITDREYRKTMKKDGSTENRKWYKYTCNKCGWTEGWIIEGSLNSGIGCASCSGRTATPMNNIWNNARWMCKWISEEDAKKYTPQSNKKIEVVCPDCGKKKKLSIDKIYNRKSICCTCGDNISYGNKYVHCILDQLELNYKTEVKYDWNKYINPKNNNLSQALVDFVIYHDNREIPLEADGEFHRQDNKMSGQTKEMSEYIDKQRDENCLKHLGEETIRISDEGDIKENILNSKLNKLFDLSNIDWDKCEEFALKNIVKEVCNYWNNKEDWETTKDLGEIYKMSPTTIRNYLKKGLKLNWCKYNLDEINRSRALKSSKTRTKMILLYRDGLFIKKFNSVNELELLSKNLLGTHLSAKGIYRVCSGERKHYKGYTFKQVTRKNYEEYLKSQEIEGVM